MPNQPASVNAISVGVSNYSPNNRYFRIPPGAYIATASSGYPEVVATASQIDSNIISSNIKAGTKIVGVSGSPSVVDTADGTATAGHILSGATGYVNGSKITGTIPSKGSATITPTTYTQTIASGQYISGTQTIPGDPDLIASNIRSGASIFGVTGTLTPVAGNPINGTYSGQSGYSALGVIPFSVIGTNWSICFGYALVTYNSITYKLNFTATRFPNNTYTTVYNYWTGSAWEARQSNYTVSSSSNVFIISAGQTMQFTAYYTLVNY